MPVSQKSDDFATTISNMFKTMNLTTFCLALAFSPLCLIIVVGCASDRCKSVAGAPPQIAVVSRAMQDCINRKEIAGAVTLVASRDEVLHLAANGQADIATHAPMREDSIFWIASMTKPVTAVAILMLQEEGKLSVDDPVAKYLPELADVKTTNGTPGNLTLKELLTHTSGLSDATPEQYRLAKNLADLIPIYAQQPLQFTPGSRWQYCQSGINSLGRIVEIVSGKSYPKFLQERIFSPLKMKDTTFYPTEAQVARLAKSYESTNGMLEEVPISILRGHSPTFRDRYPAPNGGLFSTASDYGRFCQMLLNQGSLDGRQYLKPESVQLMSRIQTGNLKTGFTDGNGWGLGVCVVREPQGVTAMLSPGSFGHGGAYGTQAWIDPVKGLVYVLMVQRSNFPISDSSDVRAAFQSAAAEALEKR
jgi:CubicO group peptidase (beta-lactamase class C family)